MTGFEPVTSSLPRKHSTPELHRLEKLRAGDEARTRDLQLGRLSLYQLSYSRLILSLIQLVIKSGQCGGSRIRTCEDISQRSYSPSQLAALVSPRVQ